MGTANVYIYPATISACARDDGWMDTWRDVLGVQSTLIDTETYLGILKVTDI